MTAGVLLLGMALVYGLFAGGVSGVARSVDQTLHEAATAPGPASRQGKATLR